MSLVTLNDRAVRSVTTFGSVGGDSMVFIKKLTASSSGTLSFVDGSSDVVFDGTYKQYMFIFNNIHPATDQANLTFQVSTDGGSNYNTTLTSTHFRTYSAEDGSAAAITYYAAGDQGQGTSFEQLAVATGSDNDQCVSGIMHFFNPADTTFVKHFVSTFSNVAGTNFETNEYNAGYFNTTSAVDAVQFKYSSGNIDSGTISLYGIS